MKEYVVNLIWDEEAAVWVAISDMYPMALESGSLDCLIERVRVATPELLELNGLDKEPYLIKFQAERVMSAVG